MEWAVLIWILVSAAAGLNLSAAGVAAILHAWRVNMRRGGRMFAAAVIAALVPTSGFVAIALSESATATSEDPFIVAIVFLAIQAVCTLVSLPGAAVVARKLEHPGDDFRVFE